MKETLETYDLKKLYIKSRKDHSWQNEVTASTHGVVAVKAPGKTGKTYVCRQDIISVLKNGSHKEAVLYFTPDRQDNVKMAYGVQILMGLDNRTVCNRTPNNVYVTENMERGTSVYVPADEIAFARVIASGIKFAEIIIDDAERMSASLLHNALLKAAVDGACMMAVGGGTPYGAPQDKKDVWRWLLNSPSSDTYVVEYSAGNAVDYDEDLLGIFSPLLQQFNDVA